MKKILYTFFAAATVLLSGCNKNETTESPETILPESKTITINGVDFKFVLVKAGTFNMGSPVSESDRKTEDEGLTWIRLEQDYYMSETEITQAQWKVIMGSLPIGNQTPVAPDLTADNYPVVSFYWTDICGGENQEHSVATADCFLAKISAKAKTTFRLPTDAEWEYAARGGHKMTSYTKYPGTNNEGQLGNYAWFKGNTTGKPHKVATKLPNVLGLYDMAGNVMEFCCNKQKRLIIGTPKSPVIESQYYMDTVEPILRGGTFNTESSYCRNALKIAGSPTSLFPSIGFRLVFLP